MLLLRRRLYFIAAVYARLQHVPAFKFSCCDSWACSNWHAVSRRWTPSFPWTIGVVPAGRRQRRRSRGGRMAGASCEASCKARQLQATCLHEAGKLHKPLLRLFVSAGTSSRIPCTAQHTTTHAVTRTLVCALFTLTSVEGCPMCLGT